MSRPSTVSDVSVVRRNQMSTLRGSTRICVSCPSHLRRLVGESAKETGDDDDDDDVDETVSAVATDSFASDLDLWGDVWKGFVFPGYARHQHFPFSVERNPVESIVHAGRRPLRDSTCLSGYSRKCPIRCRLCQSPVLVSL